MKPEDKSKLVLVLLLIQRSFNDSYNLTRVMERKFGVFSFAFPEKLVEEGYVESELKKGISYYSVTDKGMRFLELEYFTSLCSLLGEYPEETELIVLLFQRGMK